MFERFTDWARQVLVLAQEEARLLGHGFIGTEHELLGVVAGCDPVTAPVLVDFRVDPERLRTAVRAGRPVRAGEQPTSPPFTPRAKRVLEQALREARRLGDTSIGPEHILLALLVEDGSRGAQALRECGVDLVALGDALSEEIRRRPASPASLHPRGRARRGRRRGWTTDPGQTAEPFGMHPDDRVVFDVVEARQVLCVLDGLDRYLDRSEDDTAAALLDAMTSAFAVRAGDLRAGSEIPGAQQRRLVRSIVSGLRRRAEEQLEPPRPGPEPPVE